MRHLNYKHKTMSTNEIKAQILERLTQLEGTDIDGIVFLTMTKGETENESKISCYSNITGHNDMLSVILSMYTQMSPEQMATTIIWMAAASSKLYGDKVSEILENLECNE